MSDEQEQLIKTPGPLGDNFLLERELGSGGMGGVYLGRDVMLDRPVAVKVMQKQYGEDPEFLASFKREAQAAAKLIHPNIAQIYSYGVVDDMPYIAMELVAGGSLLQVMNNAPDGKTDIARVLKICEQVAQALRCAADQGLVHGDIKPDNILLDANGNAKLVDFGLAGMQKDSTEIWGTPYYIAPEKLRKDTVDYRADMYNLGGTLYHALTGVAPFEGADANAVVRKRFEGRPKKPSEIRSDISPAIDALVMKMLELEKQDRYPTFEALLAAFKEVMTNGLDPNAPATKSTGAGGKLKLGGRRLTVRGTRKLTSSKKMSVGGADAADVPEEDENLEAGVGGGMLAAAGGDTGDEDEENSNVGKKMILGLIGGIVALGLIAGCIAWYMISTKRSEERALQESIVKGMKNARDAIALNCTAAEKFGKEFQSFTEKAIDECEKATRKIADLVPDFADRLKPPPSAVLLAAIASTNTPVVVASGTNVVGSVSNAVAQTAAEIAVVAKAQSAAAGGFQLKQFRPPTPEEADPSSPEGEEYQKKKNAFQEEQLKLFTEAMEHPEKAAESKPAEKPTAAAESDDDLGTSDDPEEKIQIAIKKLERRYKREIAQVGEEAVTDLNDIWNHAYSCQACEIKIHVSISNILAVAKKADAYVEDSEVNAKELGALSSTLLDLYNQLKGSKEVEAVRKDMGFIKNKSAKSIKQTSDNLYRRRAEFEREKKKLEYQLGKARDEKSAGEARKKLVSTEQEQAKLKFDALQQNKNFELLEWDSAIRDIEFMKSGFKTPEGVLAADDQLKKVKAMKSVQEILVKNLKNYQFKKSRLKKDKATVREANMREIMLSRPEANSKIVNYKINWVKFYKEYHANFNELIIQFIENGRKNCEPKLTLQEWGDAMCGAALTLRIICADDPAAATRGEQLAKDVAKAFPSYTKTLRMMFPDLTFEDVLDE